MAFSAGFACLVATVWITVISY
ncbi:hypothetical protein MED193_02775 [Roseobacter sp. MED193]|nr:hypothetical protein MED193_02775 [Roseobacter sp. MED193]